MIEALIAIVLIFVVCAVFGISKYVVLSVIAAIMVVGAIVAWLIDKRKKEDAENVARAILIEETAVYKEEVQNTGFSIGWRGSGRSYFRYKNVLDYYECVFSVKYKDGRTGRIKCRKDSDVYNILIWKTKNK